MNPGANKRVIVCLAASDTLGGKVLRWVFRSSVNHAFIIYRSTEWDCWEAIQINQHGVHKVFAIKIIKDRAYNFIRAFEAKYDLWDGVLRNRYHIGRSYDWKGVFVGLLKGLLNRYFKVRINKQIHTGNALFCSEYVAEVIKSAYGSPVFQKNHPGINTDLFSNPSEIAPYMLLQHFRGSKFYEEIEFEQLERKILMGY
jgi:hypothetical protein